MTKKFDPWTHISQDEFQARQDRAKEAAQDEGLSGLLIYSRGGATLDMFADVLYLTNHYSQLPYVADHFGIGSAISHSAVIMPVDGPNILVVDIPWWRTDLVVADEVRHSNFVSEAVGKALQDSKLLGKRLAFVGAGFMTASAYLGLLDVAGETDLVRMDDLIEKQRVKTSSAEREIIREAAAIGSRTVDAIMDNAIEGNTEAEAIAAALSVTVPAGAVFYDAASTSGSKAHHYAWSRLPSYDVHRKLENGDLFHVDCYGIFGGYQWDFGRTRVIGDQPSELQELLIKSSIGIVAEVCAFIKPGLTGSLIHAHAEQWLAESELGKALNKQLPDVEKIGHVGHGIGLSWSTPWLMPGDQTVLETGMYVAVEMMFGKKGLGAALHEENGLLTDDGFEVLTTSRQNWQ